MIFRRSGHAQKHVYVGAEERRGTTYWLAKNWSRRVVHIPDGVRPRFSSPWIRREQEGNDADGKQQGEIAVRADWPRDLTLCKRTGQLSAVSPFFGFHAHCVHRPQCQEDRPGAVSAWALCTSSHVTPRLPRRFISLSLLPFGHSYRSFVASVNFFRFHRATGTR